MLRRWLVRHKHENDLLPYHQIRWRGHDVSRLEGFSDAAFGFALTLLVASQQIPRNFGELIGDVRGFVAFLLCFTVLSIFWHCHYTFFRLYGLRDSRTVFLNLVLLAFVLFSVYPLKFLADLIVVAYLHIAPTGVDINGLMEITLPQLVTLLVIYSLGLAAIFLIFAALYANAFRQRRELELTPLEIFDTRIAIIQYVIVTLVCLLSASIAGSSHGVKGIFHIKEAIFVYFLIPMLLVLLAAALRPQRRKLTQPQLQSKEI